MIYLHPFGSTQPENIEALRDDTNPPDLRDPPLRRGPIFIFYDQEPLNFVYNQNLFDRITSNRANAYILVSTEKTSKEKDLLCDKYNMAHIDYFFHIFAATDWYRGHEFLVDLVPPEHRSIKKTFITFNRITSNERVYRSLFINSLFTNSLLNSGHVSFSRDCPDGGAFDSNLVKAADSGLVPRSLVEKAISNISTLPDLRIDFADHDYIPNQSMLLSPLDKLMESFVFVVTETCYWQSKTHLTEKIFKPIVLRMPFLLLGCPLNLDYLRSYGFKTFGDFWDESYDTEVDPLTRLDKVVKILKDLDKLTDKQKQNMLVAMKPVLDHNYNVFNDPGLVRGEWNHLCKSLKDIVPFYPQKPLDGPYRFDAKTKQSIPLVPN